MIQFACAEAVWRKIRSLSARRGRKKAAVSYVTSDAVVKFGAGDLLVVEVD